jgi:hypothetical protein
MWYRKKPMWYWYFRCGIGIFPLRAFSDTTSEIISNREIGELQTYAHYQKVEVNPT